MKTIKVAQKKIVRTKRFNEILNVSSNLLSKIEYLENFEQIEGRFMRLIRTTK